MTYTQNVKFTEDPQSFKPIYIPFFYKCQHICTFKISFTFNKKAFPMWHMYHLLHECNNMNSNIQ